MRDSFLKNPRLFLFGSVASFLSADSSLLDTLRRLPFYTYINLGLESVDPGTLSVLKKPVDAGDVRKAFDKMLTVNRQYGNIEVTGNFLLGDRLPDSHDRTLFDLLANGIDQPYGKGAVYLSPLEPGENGRKTLNRFFRLKRNSRLPVFIYLIQRL